MGFSKTGWFAVRTGLEPVTSCVTGRHSNQAELTHQHHCFFNCGCKGMQKKRDLQKKERLFTKKVALKRHS